MAPSVCVRAPTSRGWARAEAEVPGAVGRGELDDAQAVLAVGDVGEEPAVGHAELDVARVVDRAAGVEHLVEPRLLGPLDVDDRQPCWARRDVGVRPREVEAVRLRAAARRRPATTRGRSGTRDVDHLSPRRRSRTRSGTARRRARGSFRRRAEHGRDERGCSGSCEVDDHEARGRGDVGVIVRPSVMRRGAGQDAVRVEGGRPRQTKLFVGVAVEQASGAVRRRPGPRRGR